MSNYYQCTLATGRGHILAGAAGDGRLGAGGGAGRGGGEPVRQRRLHARLHKWY